MQYSVSRGGGMGGMLSEPAPCCCRGQLRHKVQYC
jgi:hypothetical protein